MLTFTLDRQGTSAAVAFTGDLDIDATELIGEELAPQLAACERVHIDFSNVTFVDSSGIGLLIALVKQVQGRGHSIAVARLREDVKTVFEMLQLPEIVGKDVFPELE
ncbi:STAS domain-containing protein [Paenibacillus sp.]|uniref:STAS domain-containing protein n=1 Tax=Paenibacillus sp. TaxID=58172 RepID=UPI002D41A678|nr:STAS domain-containing protein [Paenibacillus sp.]HZG88334.1 STAS domain-containing protein [Paenibacillus sp.]